MKTYYYLTLCSVASFFILSCSGDREDKGTHDCFQAIDAEYQKASDLTWQVRYDRNKLDDTALATRLQEAAKATSQFKFSYSNGECAGYAQRQDTNGESLLDKVSTFANELTTLKDDLDNHLKSDSGKMFHLKGICKKEFEEKFDVLLDNIDDQETAIKTHIRRFEYQELDQQEETYQKVVKIHKEQKSELISFLNNYPRDANCDRIEDEDDYIDLGTLRNLYISIESRDESYESLKKKIDEAKATTNAQSEST